MKKSIPQLSGLLPWLAVGIIGAMFAFLMLSRGPTTALAGPPTVFRVQPAMFQVHPETTFQTMVGFGAGFSGDSLVDIDAIKSPQDRNFAYDLLYKEQGIGANLNIIRLTISFQAKKLNAPTAQGILYDWAGDQGTQMVWKAIQPVLDEDKPLSPPVLNKDKPFQSVRKKKRLILYAVPFTPPIQWKTNQQAILGGSLLPQYYPDYAEYLADFVDYYHKVLQVDIDVLSLQNEPGVVAPWPSCIWTGAEMRDFLKVLAPAIQGRGLHTKLMLSEGTNWNGAWVHLLPTLQDATALPWLNIIASHSYGNPQDNVSRKNFAAASVQYGLPVWMSEMSIIGPPEDAGMGAGISIAQYIYHDLVEGNACVWIYCFAVFRPYTHNINGSLSVLSVATDGALVVPKRFWTMAQYSHFVRPGWKRMQIDGLGFANTGFVDPTGKHFVIVALNASEKPRAAKYDFGQGTIGAVDAFCTTEKLNMHHDQNHQVVPLSAQPHGFTATLPPTSVTTFTGQLLLHPLIKNGNKGVIIPKVK